MPRFLFVSSGKSFGILALAAAVCFSQTITISGTVTNSSGAAIPGAKVKLEKENKEVVTKADGKFSFDPTGIDSKGNSLQIKKVSAHWRDNILFLDIFKKCPVEITTYALNGQAVFSMHKVMDAGMHDITLPLRGNGVYICRIKSGNGEMKLKNIPMGGATGSASINLSGIVATAKMAASNAAITDILTVTKENYLDWQVEVWKADTTLKIEMIDCAGTVTDASGNVYQSVKIGTQIWATGNLKTKKYNDGTDIPWVSDGGKWSGLTSPGWCYPDGIEEKGKRGLLYNWYAASHPKIAPEGWHSPTIDDEFTLRKYMISAGFNYDGTKYDNWIGDKANENDKENSIAKAMCSRILWKITPKPGAGESGGKEGYGKDGVVWNGKHLNNKSGLNLLPCGSRWDNASFHQTEESCYIWSSTANDAGSGKHTSVHTWQRFYGNNSHNKKLGACIILIKN